MSAFNFAAGTVVGGHRIEEVLGRGAMGVVYRAVDAESGRAVALKVVYPDIAEDPRYRVRFLREAKLVASLEHPNVIRVWGCGEDAGTLFISMELIEGPDLGVLLANGPMPVERAISIISDIAAALDVAHASSIVHRDVKPQNILILGRDSRDRAVLTDFGLAKASASSLSMGGHRGVLGAPAYIAPEQIEGTAVDARADVYALGCVLFEALTGELPFARTRALDMALAHVGRMPPRLGELAPDAPRLLEDVLARALSKAPEERHASAGDFARAAHAALAGTAEFQVAGSVATGRAAPRGSTRAFHRIVADPPKANDPRPATARDAARRRAAAREARRAAERESERSAARLARVGQAGGVPEARAAHLRALLRPGERATAAAMCSIEGESVDDTVLVTTTQRVIWSGVRGAPGVVEADQLTAVSVGEDLTLTLLAGPTHRFASWRADKLRQLGTAAQALIDARGRAP